MTSKAWHAIETLARIKIKVNINVTYLSLINDTDNEGITIPNIFFNHRGRNLKTNWKKWLIFILIHKNFPYYGELVEIKKENNFFQL